MLKFIFIVLFLVVFSIISLPLYFIVFIIGKFSPRKKVAVSQAIVSRGFKFILFNCGIKVKVEGLENIPKDEAVLYVGNHRSYFDILAAYATVPNLTGFVAKDSMRKFPCISSWMKRINCLFLDREDVRQGLKVILKAIELVKDGYSIFIMPEGTRNSGEELLPFKDASFKIADKSGCAVVPVAMVGTDDRFEKQLPRVKRGTIYVRYGTPVYMKDLEKEDRKHPGELFRGIIADMLDDMKKNIK